MRTGSVFSSLAVRPASVNTVINLKQFRELNSRGSFVRYSHKRLKVEIGGREAFCSGVGGNHSRFAEGFSQNRGDLLSQGTKEGSLRRQACSTGCVRGGLSAQRPWPFQSSSLQRAHLRVLFKM